MKTISLRAIKGGVGKTSICILLTQYWAGIGKKVLLIDTNLENSLSCYCNPLGADIDTKNIAYAILTEVVQGNIFKVNNHIDLLQSSPNLQKVINCPIGTLSIILQRVKEQYDYCIIDTAPSVLDNLILNAYKASDIILTPINLDSWDIKAGANLAQQFKLYAPEDFKKWKIVKNSFRSSRTLNPEAVLNQYNSQIDEQFGPWLLDTDITQTALVRQVTNEGLKLSENNKKHIKLLAKIKQLAEELEHIEKSAGGLYYTA